MDFRLNSNTYWHITHFSKTKFNWRINAHYACMHTNSQTTGKSHQLPNLSQETHEFWNRSQALTPQEKWMEYGPHTDIEATHEPNFNNQKWATIYRNTHQINSLQCEQKVGCRRNVAMNLCPFTWWTRRRIAPRRFLSNPCSLNALGSSTTTTGSIISEWKCHCYQLMACSCGLTKTHRAISSRPPDEGCPTAPGPPTGMTSTQAEFYLSSNMLSLYVHE